MAAETPAEAGALELEEPDWRERFETHCARWPEDPCATEWGFAATLRDWRRWHATPIVVGGEAKKLPAPSTDGIIALATFGIFAPRWLLEDRPRGGSHQHDAHMWLQLRGEQWRVNRIEDRALYLYKMFEPEFTRAIDLNVDWIRYIDNAIKILEAMRAP
jgi:hypothetical protein